ncbi:hypothetical protein [Flavihumibacter petaseus]|uniref:Uncharacterized protein n=1 Tax=Flavihumibacter petaseus NBRC 106054 TaxID=1220578 RepID=A0A0E9N1L2_9BACT|nr:hypothetical protein [Flavihumibacter petaseus]GAO43516.1 hypothetical protein FPE01S_02_06210 [Flavihumibacter petaseus NBRC 106054]
MRYLFILLLLSSLSGYGQLKSYLISVKGDTINRVDANGKKQGPWVNHIDPLRGEPGYEEEGVYKDDRKEGTWRNFNLTGDLFAIENYRWGFKDGASQYFNISGGLTREESWRAFNPDKEYDSVDVEDVNSPGNYTIVVVKNEGAAVKHGTWKFYDGDGFITKTEFWTLGKPDKSLQPPTLARDTMTTAKKSAKPKEVLDYEKKNSGKKKVRVRDGTVSY